MRRSASALGRRNLPVSLSSAGESLQHDLLKLRAVLISIRAPRGSKLSRTRAIAAELSATGRHFSLRSIYRWRERYLALGGFAGIARQVRSDRWNPKHSGYDFLISMVDCATRACHPGDIRHAYRQLKPAVCYETFRREIRRIQAQLKGEGQ